MNLLDGLVEFWRFNDTLVGVKGTALVSDDGLGHFLEGKSGSAWESYTGSTWNTLSGTTAVINPNASGLTMAFWTRQIPSNYFYPSNLGVLSLSSSETERLDILGRKTGSQISIAGRVISGGLNTVQPSNAELAVPMDQWALVGASFGDGIITARVNDKKADTFREAPFCTDVSWLMFGTVPALNGKLIGLSENFGIWNRVLSDAEWLALLAGWEPSSQTIKQHLIVSPSGIIQPVGSSIVVPGWV